jgi:hypothetical protein
VCDGRSVLCRVRDPRGELPIWPLQEAVADMWLAGLPVARWQEQEAEAVGLAVVDVAADEPLPALAKLVCLPGTLFGREALRAVLNGATAHKGAIRAAIAPQTPLWRALWAPRPPTPAAPLPVDLWGGVRPGSLPPTRDALGELSNAAVVAIASETGAVALPTAPWGAPPHLLRLSTAQRLLASPTHWLQLLECALLFCRLAREQRGCLGQRRILGRGCRVHPTALVEGSILGDNVTVEAHASVIDSVVGDDVHIADHTVVHSSMLGPGCRTLVDTHLRRVVALGDATLSNLDMADAIFGRGVFLTTGVAFFATPASGGPGVNVVVDGQDTGRPVLGGAIGRGAILGSRALFACGAALPPDALVVARPHEALARPDDEGLARAGMRRVAAPGRAADDVC